MYDSRLPTTTWTPSRHKLTRDTRSAFEGRCRIMRNTKIAMPQSSTQDRSILILGEVVILYQGKPHHFYPNKQRKSSVPHCVIPRRSHSESRLYGVINRDCSLLGLHSAHRRVCQASSSRALYIGRPRQGFADRHADLRRSSLSNPQPIHARSPPCPWPRTN